MKTDLEIANAITPKPILEIAKALNIEDIDCYGKFQAKLPITYGNKKGKLILVTSTNPTPYGEGKTTITIGLHDALCKLGKKSIATLREPSLGPVFGIKGGATGGGYAQVIPMENINLHFTGDIHAVESCNNLLCAIIDNHIFNGNELDIDLETLNFPRAMDINDRSLRNIKINSTYERNDSFVITTASEIMAILCLSKDLEDLKHNLSQIVIGYSKQGKPIFVSDLHCEEALTILLKDAIRPNLVQTLEHNPVLIHGGPFANIAHGCNSIIATKMALSTSDYVVTEAGFGSDLGAEKFIDIKCRKADIKPDVIVLNTTVRSLKYNGNGILEKGISNLEAHIENMKKLTNNLIICINKFDSDTNEELDFIKSFVIDKGFPISICNAYEKGSDGAIELANEVINICNHENEIRYLYEENESLISKLKKLASFYHANNINFENNVLKKIETAEKNGFGNLPICIAKTQYSISDNPKMLGFPKDYTLHVTDIKICNGAGFIVVYLGNIMTMPGLSKNAAYLDMQIDKNGTIKGLF